MVVYMLGREGEGEREREREREGGREGEGGERERERERERGLKRTLFTTKSKFCGFVFDLRDDVVVMMEGTGKELY